jgi:hypothetical protein
MSHWVQCTALSVCGMPGNSGLSRLSWWHLWYCIYTREPEGDSAGLKGDLCGRTDLGPVYYEGK